MSTDVLAQVKPLGNFPVAEDVDIKGGLRTVSAIEVWEAEIALHLRKAGMQIADASTGVVWRLDGALELRPTAETAAVEAIEALVHKKEIASAVDWRFVVADEETNEVGFGVDKDSNAHVEGLVLGSKSSGNCVTIQRYLTLSGYAPVVVVDDETGKILVQLGEPEAEDPVGLTPVTYDLHRLRQVRQKMGSLKSGTALTQLRIAMIGDSWMFNWAYFVDRLTSRLVAEYGDGGFGWYGFGGDQDNVLRAHRSARSAVASHVFSGGNAWDMGNLSTGPCRDSLISSQAGDQIIITTTVSQENAILVYQGAVASFRWRIGAGSWTTVNAGGSGLVSTSLGPVPAGTLTIEVVSGTVNFCGIRFDDGGGVRIDKLGVPGSDVPSWIARGQTWADGVGDILDPHCILIMFGTNDQLSTGAGAFGTNIGELVDMLRTAMPLVDILLVCPYENSLGRSTPMSSMAAAMYAQAVEIDGAAFVDLNQVAGDLADYDGAGTLDYLATDGAHPSYPGVGATADGDGGSLIVETLYRAFTS
jgi:lysophospholipase L1-like esterase